MAAATALVSLCSSLFDHGASLVHSATRSLLSISLFLSFLQYMGWLHRALHFWLEWWLSDISNGATVTVGSFDYDVWHGQVLVYNVIVHTPKQDEWLWSSPIIARVGRLHVQFSWSAWIINVLSQWSFQKAPIDIYTVEVADAQVFIERQEQVFNFYLLDDSIILPDPKNMVNAVPAASAAQSQLQGKEDEGGGSNSSDEITTSMEKDNNGSEPQEEEQDKDAPAVTPTTTTRTDCEQRPKDDDKNDTTAIATAASPTEEEAEQLVDQMLTTVQQLVLSTTKSSGRNGGWKGALDQHRHSLTQRLKELQSQPNKVSAVQQGVRVMRQVGQAVAKKTQDSMNSASAGPLRKENVEPPPQVRVGRVVIRELRIFTRDDAAFGTVSGGAAATTAASSTNNDNMADQHVLLFEQWNKPIRIETVIVRASELCPPMSLVDATTTTTTRGGAAVLPAIYQPLDKAWEVVWKRILAESAKSQGGRLLNAAIGQVLGLMKSSAA